MTLATASPTARPLRPEAARRPLLQVSLRPTPGLVEPLHAFVLALTSQVVGGPELGARVGLALHELLENAVKHSLDGKAVVRVDVAESEGAPRIAVTVSNRAAADRIAALRRSLDAPAAEAPEAGPCPGLVRLRAEGGLTVRGEVDGDVVAITAEARGGPR